MKFYKVSILLLLILFSSISQLRAQAPRTFSYQGLMTNTDGSTPEDGAYSITFNLYNQPNNGPVLWSETHNVNVVDGIFNAILGNTTPLNLQFNAPYWLGIAINGQPEMAPRIELTASPYSLHALSVADSSITLDKLVPHVVSSINGVNNHGGNIELVAGSNVNISSDDDNNTITISATPGGGGGDITAVTAGEGLTGGGTAGDVVLSIDENGVDEDKIADNTVVRSINNVTDAVILRGEGGATISTQNDTIIITAGNGSGQSGWSLTGNAGLTGAQFVGTTDSTVLNIRVNNQRAYRFEPSPSSDPDSPNIIGGSVVNSSAAGVAGATISGGGGQVSGGPSPNSVAASFGTIGGGLGNQVNEYAGVVGGGQGNIINGDYSTIGGGNGNDAQARATVAGGWGNDASGTYSTVGGGFTNRANGFRSVIAGGSNNTADAQFSSVAGGFSNEAEGDYAAINGGNQNTATGDYSTVGGGNANEAGARATIAGGWSNDANGTYSAVGGGFTNRANGRRSVVAGGSNNTVDGQFSSVAGGFSNEAGGDYAAINGGNQNTAEGLYSSVGGGFQNQATAAYATIAGGGGIDDNESISINQVHDNYGTIGGGGGNEAGYSPDNDPESGHFATVAGGARNKAKGSYSFVGGGNRNTAGTPFAIGTIEDVPYATITGGLQNSATGEYTSIGGGYLNAASRDNATVSGGVANKVSAQFGTISGGGWTTEDDQSTGNRVTDDYGTVAGGGNNQAGNGTGTQIDAFYATVSGGVLNNASARYTTVGGGVNNQAGSDVATVAGGQNNVANGPSATIGGGTSNVAGGTYSTIAGGSSNVVNGVQRATIGGGGDNTVSGSYATIPGGGGNNAAGDYSFAAGYRATADHPGAFVWADNPPIPGNTGVEFSSTGSNQFLIRAEGGVGIGSNDPRGGLLILNEVTPPAGLPASNNGLMLGIQSTAGYKWIQSYGGSLILNPISNNIGIGVTAPTQRLHVNGNVLANQYLNASSRRYKTNINTIENALETVQKLRGVTYIRKNDGKADIGLIAEEVGEVLPEIVAYEENGVDATSVDYARLVALLIEATKQQQKEIEALKSMIQTMRQ